MEKLQLSPVESEVVVLYDGEKVDQSEEFWKGKRIVEMEKPRPNWFSKNLLQKTTQPNASTKEVKPDELGWSFSLNRSSIIGGSFSSSEESSSA